MSLKKYIFPTFFDLYPKQLSYFCRVFEQVPACQSIFLFKHIILLFKINSFNFFRIFNSFDANSGRFIYRYSLTNRTKKYEVIPIILLI